LLGQRFSGSGQLCGNGAGLQPENLSKPADGVLVKIPPDKEIPIRLFERVNRSFHRILQFDLL
jgi:hypothetical protein